MLGIFKYDLCQVLKYYIHFRQIFTLDKFNDAKSKELYDYGSKSKGDVSVLILINHLRDEKIHIEAKEMWTLIENLPLILMDLVTDYRNCEIFKFVVKMTEVLYQTTRKSYSEEDITEMQENIKEHHRLYLTIFNRPGNETHLTPKFHVMLHYELYIHRFGPPRGAMTFKFEMKHQELKKYAQQCYTRKNLPYSLCKKFSLQFAYNILTKPKLFQEINDVSFKNSFQFTSAVEDIKYCSKLTFKG